MDETRCQSCGQPIGISNYGTNASGTQNFEYCSMCFQKGAFTDPDLTLPLMIQMSVNHMVGSMGKSEEEARALATSVIPTLKRWRNAQI